MYVRINCFVSRITIQYVPRDASKPRTVYGVSVPMLGPVTGTGLAFCHPFLLNAYDSFILENTSTELILSLSNLARVPPQTLRLTEVYNGQSGF
jgi:hypothetical protein